MTNASQVTPHASNPKVIVSAITLAKGAATKHYHLDENGRIAKGGSSISSGTVHVVETTLAEIANCPPNTFMQSDVPKRVAPGQSVVFTARGAGTNDGTPFIHRTKECFEHRTGTPGVLAFDNDPKDDKEAVPAIQYLAGEALRDALIHAIPDLAQANATWTPSSSCGDIADANGNVLQSKRGGHLRVAVTDMSDIPRALGVVFKRLVLAGHGSHFVEKAGFGHTRTIIDASLKTPARAIYCAPATLGPDLSWKWRPETQIWNGGLLDTRTAIPDLTEDEEARYRAVTDRLRDAPASVALRDARRAQYVAERPHRKGIHSTVKVQR